ncbi:unnamed protein product [Anisakis simplex]|uniref:MYND-type domain-containing protein n=1 Tax=Anisakis simplex TaxID=6269 RepID=A0A0M3K970_ANISI|nr:unnamed protein product [Anisakis simplex]
METLDGCIHLAMIVIERIELIQMNDASNMRAFRCQLPRRNAFYSYDNAFDPDLDGDVPNPFFNPSTYPNLCQICGCLATKKCARCQLVWYCSREHQAMDWSCSHKRICGKTEEEIRQLDEQKQLDESDKINGNDSSVERSQDDGVWSKSEISEPENGFVFGEYGIDMDIEYLRGTDRMESDDEDDDQEVSEEQINEYKKYLKKHHTDHLNTLDEQCKHFKEMSKIPSNELEEVENSIAKDNAFSRFSKIISVNPKQILRYERNGKPLYATDNAPKIGADEIPNCELCGGARRFELQLMPYLLSLISVDHIQKSIDWASVFLFTCQNNCQINSDGYTEEFVFKQDF